MVDVVLDSQQSALIANAQDGVRVLDSSGRVIAVIQPEYEPLPDLTVEQIEEIRRRMQTTEGNLLTTDELIERLDRRVGL
jgi:hypothetical protein